MQPCKHTRSHTLLWSRRRVLVEVNIVCVRGSPHKCYIPIWNLFHAAVVKTRDYDLFILPELYNSNHTHGTVMAQACNSFLTTYKIMILQGNYDNYVFISFAVELTQHMDLHK